MPSSCLPRFVARVSNDKLIVCGVYTERRSFDWNKTFYIFPYPMWPTAAAMHNYRLTNQKPAISDEAGKSGHGGGSLHEGAEDKMPWLQWRLGVLKRPTTLPLVRKLIRANNRKQRSSASLYLYKDPRLFQRPAPGSSSYSQAPQRGSDSETVYTDPVQGHCFHVVT